MNTLEKSFITLAILLLSGLHVFSQEPVDTSSKFQIGANVGVGMVRSTISPTVNINVIYTIKNAFEFHINTSSYFFFPQDEVSKSYKTYMNSFLNAEYLVRGGKTLENIKDMQKAKIWEGFGIGYLIQRDGDYFKGTTMKIYSITKLKHCSIMPELIFTDNFKTVFPDISFRFYIE